MKKHAITTGDIHRVGNHTVACGDSRDPEFIRSVLDNQHIALILTDVPYAVAYKANKFAKEKSKHVLIANDHLQSDEEFTSFTQAWLEAVRPHLAPKNAAYTFCSDKMLFAFRKGMLAAGYRFGQLLHWIKTASVVGRLDYAPQHETLLYFWHGRHEFMKSHDKSVIIHPKPLRNKFHPTEKPIPILRRLILNSSHIGDVVYDPMAGSGTSALAAEETGRHSISIDIEEKYCRIIIDRLEKRTGRKAMPISQSKQ